MNCWFLHFLALFGLISAVLADAPPVPPSTSLEAPRAMTASALLLIDTQVNMFDPASPVASAEPLLARLSSLVQRARAAHLPIILVRNCGQPGDPDQQSSPGWELHPSLRPKEGDVVLDKTTQDTFASTALGDLLKARGIGHLIIAGLQSEYCVRETTLGALARHLTVTLVSDGHSTYDGTKSTALQTSAAVNAEFAGRVTLAAADSLRFP